MNLSHLYSVEREFNVAIEKLWQAWTEATALEKWHHPVGMSCPSGTCRSEMQVGGIWSYAVEVPGRESTSFFFGKFTEIREKQFFEHSMHYTESAEDFKQMNFNTPAHNITVEFESRGDKSWCKFSQFGQAPAEQVALMTQGIESYFDSLEDYLK